MWEIKKKVIQKITNEESRISRSPGRIFIALFVFFVISQVVYNSGVLFSMNYYTEDKYITIWSDIILSLSGSSPEMGFFYISIIFGMVASILFVSVYMFLGRGLKKGPMERGLEYGMLVFMVGILPSSFFLYLLFNITEIIALWTFQNLIVYMAGGLAVGGILSEPIEKPAVNEEKTDRNRDKSQ
ncbi:MAG: hypothetical protein DRO99_03280 [Candidatus Aenigmatarchaeota archaeon]|nr:MAG: hypothetical protein DRO99_03280 [Candidatus Aenigmarchaeota archaeon]